MSNFRQKATDGIYSPSKIRGGQGALMMLGVGVSVGCLVCNPLILRVSVGSVGTLKCCAKRWVRCDSARYRLIGSAREHSTDYEHVAN